MRNFVPDRMVRATGEMQRMNIDDGDMWICEFDNDVIASIQSSYVTVGNFPGIEARIYGSEGAIIVRLVEEFGICQTIKTATKDSVEFVEREIPQEFFPAGGNSREDWDFLFYSNLCADFATEILGGEAGNQGDFAQGALVQETINAFESVVPHPRLGVFPLAEADHFMTAHTWGSLADDAAAEAILDAALAAADGRASYADARLIEAEELRCTPRAAPIPTSDSSTTSVSASGCWSTAAGGSRPAPLQDGRDAAAAAAQALDTRQRWSGTASRSTWPPRPAASGRYETAVEIDPFAVSAAERHNCWPTSSQRPVAPAAGGRRPGRASTPSASTGTSPTARAPASTSTSSRPARLMVATRPATMTCSGAATPTRSMATPAAAGWEYVSTLDCWTTRPGSARRPSPC